MQYRARQRNYDVDRIAEIVRFSDERYLDTETGRLVAVGSHGKKIVFVPYEENETTITPVTVHATTRQQIRFRINTERFK